MNILELKRWPFVLILLVGAIIQYYYSILNVFQTNELCWNSFSIFGSMSSCQQPLSDVSTGNMIEGFINLFPSRALIFAIILYLDKEGRLKFASFLVGFLLIIFGDYYIGIALVIAGILPYLIQALFEIKEHGIRSWHIAAVGGLINFYIPLFMAESGRHCQGGCDMVGLFFIGSAIYFIVAIFTLIPTIILRKEGKTKNDIIIILLFGIAETVLGIIYAFFAISTVGFNATLASGVIFIAASILFFKKESQGVPFLNYIYFILASLFIFGAVLLVVTSVPGVFVIWK